MLTSQERFCIFLPCGVPYTAGQSSRDTGPPLNPPPQNYMSRSSHPFDHEEFLQPFRGREEFLEEYFDSIPPANLTIPRPIKCAKDFVDHLGLCPPEEYRKLISGLVEAWEMTTDEGHEQLLAALRQVGTTEQQVLSLPAECLALHVLSTRRDLFETALSLDQIRKCDALQLFKPRNPVKLVDDLNAATNAFRTEIAGSCGDRFGSRRILMRPFGDDSMFTIGFYFEKAPKAQRRLTGTEQDPSLERDEARPLQFDAAIFETATGLLSIRSGFGRLTDPIRKAFAKCYLGDPNAYEWDGAAQVLNLVELFETDLGLVDVDGARPLLTEVDYSPTLDTLDSRYRITGRDVLEIVTRDRRLDQVRVARIRKVVLKMALEGTLRRRKVVLTAPNKVEFKRGTETSRIIELLHDWDVLQIPILAEAAA
jgi:hypothetical protein